MESLVLNLIAGACYEWSSRERDPISSSFARGTAIMLEAAARGSSFARRYLCAEGLC